MELFGYLFLLLSLLSSTILADAGGCYLPNGKPVDLAARCWDAGGGQTGLCCQSGDKCLNNTLCAGRFAGEPFYYRGYCTDASWTHPGCPKLCLGSDQKDHIPAVYRCNGDDKKKQGGWYCGGAGEPRDDDCEAGSFRLSDNMEPYGIADTKPELPPVTSSAEKTSMGAGDSARGRDAPTATSGPSTLQTSVLPSGASSAKPSDLAAPSDPPGTTAAAPSETRITIAQPITPIDPPSGTQPAPDPPASSTAKPSDTRPPPESPASSTTKPNSVQPSLGQPVPTSTKPSSVQPSLGSPKTESTASHPSPVPSPSPSAPSTTTTSTSTTPDPNSVGTDLPPTPLPSTTPSPSPSTQPDPSSDKPTNSAVPIAVGVAVGGSVFIAASALLFFYQRRRHRQAPVRAETPPPFEFAFINSQAPDWLGPAYGPKRPETRPGVYGPPYSASAVVGNRNEDGNGVGHVSGSGSGSGSGNGNGNARGLSEVGGTAARFELA